MRPAHLLGTLLWILFLTISLAAQGRPTTGGTPTSRPTTGNAGSMPTTNLPPSINNPNTSLPMTLFISGKVRVDDGSELTDPASIESLCNGNRHFEGYTDRKGNFSFQFGQQRNMGTSDIATTSENPTMTGRPRTAMQLRRDLQECELLAVLPGFTSQTVELAGVDPTQSTDVGTIVLHRLAHVEGLTLSATTAMAPRNAKKAYEKGRDLEQKKKWEAAEKKFEEAGQLYPRFAAAWLELARVQLQSKDVPGARESLQKSVAADPQFVSPHQLLAALEFQQRQWQQAADESGAVLRLNPISFPQDWFYNSAANYYLGHYDVAEKSARRGIQGDVDHHIPKLEYLLGVILAQKRDYQGAAEHMRNYVRLAPQAADVAQVNQQIANLDKLLSTQAASQK